MSQELQKFEGKKVVMMRGGLTHWVTDETAERLQNQLQTQSGHTFVKLKELGITINTAEVEGVYTLSQYEDVAKLKQGMFQCEYQTWHAKREECQCKKEREKEHRRIMQEAENKASSRELTPEERAANLRRIKEIGEHFRKTGIIKGAGLAMPADRKCVMCPNMCPANSKWYCDGECLGDAKKKGIYGREAEHLETVNSI